MSLVFCPFCYSSQDKRPKTLEIPYYFWRSVPEEPAGETDYKSFSHSKYQNKNTFDDPIFNENLSI